MKRVLISALACLALAACSRASTSIEASGTIEGTSVQVSSQSTGEILHLDADEGSLVKTGDRLAVIDHSALDIQLGQARSGVNLAKAELDLLTNGARGEDLAQAKDALNQANETLQNAQEDYQRMESLFKVGAATQKQRDDAESRYTIARAQASQADQALKKMENYAVLRTPAAEEHPGLHGPFPHHR